VTLKFDWSQVRLAGASCGRGSITVVVTYFITMLLFWARVYIHILLYEAVKIALTYNVHVVYRIHIFVYQMLWLLNTICVCYTR